MNVARSARILGAIGRQIREGTMQPNKRVASIDRQLEVVLRPMLKMLPEVEMLGGENDRESVLSADEENRYLAAASAQSYLLGDENGREHEALGRSKVQMIAMG